MQLTIEERHTSRASREDLWCVLDELPQSPQWDSYIVSLQRADGFDERCTQHWVPGARWAERVRRGPFTLRFAKTASGLTPGYYVEWTTHYLGVQATHGWGIEEHGPGRPNRASDERHIVSCETFAGPAPLLWIARALFRLFRARQMTQRSPHALARCAEIA